MCSRGLPLHFCELCFSLVCSLNREIWLRFNTNWLTCVGECSIKLANSYVITLLFGVLVSN